MPNKLCACCRRKENHSRPILIAMSLALVQEIQFRGTTLTFVAERSNILMVVPTLFQTYHIMNRGNILAFILTISWTAVLAVNCRCRRSRFEVEFVKDQRRGTPFARALVMKRELNKDGSRIKYTLYVEQVYDDCIEKLPRVQLVYTSSGPCGANLELHREYVLPVRKDGAASKISRCMMAVRYDRLEAKHLTYLQTRSIRKCDGKLTCAWGQMPYACSHAEIVRPKKLCNRAKQWLINYCDGCKAEWYTWTGLPACVGEADAYIANGNYTLTGGKRMLAPNSILRHTPKFNSRPRSRSAIEKQSKSMAELIAEEASKVIDTNTEELDSTENEEDTSIRGQSSKSWGGTGVDESSNHKKHANLDSMKQIYKDASNTKSLVEGNESPTTKGLRGMLKVDMVKERLSNSLNSSAFNF